MNERQKEILIEGTDAVLRGEVRRFIGDGYEVAPATGGLPRVISRKELEQGWGHGWIEALVRDKDGQLEPRVELWECVWFHGRALTGGAKEIADMEHHGRLHNGAHVQIGTRIWTGSTMPTARQCLETGWEEET